MAAGKSCSPLLEHTQHNANIKTTTNYIKPHKAQKLWRTKLHLQNYKVFNRKYHA